MTNHEIAKNKHHNSLYHSDKNPIPGRIFKQELITWEQTEFGLIRAILIRDFTPDGHNDSYMSQPVRLNPLDPNTIRGVEK